MHGGIQSTLGMSSIFLAKNVNRAPFLVKQQLDSPQKLLQHLIPLQHPPQSASRSTVVSLPQVYKTHGPVSQTPMTQVPLREKI